MPWSEGRPDIYFHGDGSDSELASYSCKPDFSEEIEASRTFLIIRFWSVGVMGWDMGEALAVEERRC